MTVSVKHVVNVDGHRHQIAQVELFPEYFLNMLRQDGLCEDICYVNDMLC